MNKKENRRVALLLSPGMLLLIIFFFIPTGYLVVYSFSQYDPTEIVKPIFTFENYVNFFTDEYILGLMFRTFRISIIASLFTLIIGFPLAYYMRRARGTEKSILAIIVLTPMMISHVILGYAWMVLLAPNSGLLSEGLNALGFLSDPLQLMNTETGMIIGLVHFTLVYMVINLHSSLETIDSHHLKASEILGARPVQTFFKIILPLSLPGMFSGILTVFAVSTSALMIPMLLGGGRVPVLATYIYDLNKTVLNWPMGAAAALILLGITLISTFVLNVIVNKLRDRLGMNA